MEELEAKKRAKERLKKATMHREDIDEMRRVFKTRLLIGDTLQAIIGDSDVGDIVMLVTL